MGEYNRESSCPKCGHADIDTWYCTGNRYGCSRDPRDYRDYTEMGREHIDRTCRNCRFTWAEDCLDSKESGDG